MTCYIRNDQKKRRILARNESQLLRVLRRGGSERAILEAAEAVRASTVRVLRVERARILPSSDLSYAARYKKIDSQVAECLVMPLDAIVSKYRRELDRVTERVTDSGLQ